MSNLPYRPNPKPTQRQWERQQIRSELNKTSGAIWGSVIAIALISAAVKWVWHALAHVSFTPLAHHVPELVMGALIPVVIILLIANSPRIRELEYEEAFANLYPQEHLPDLRISEYSSGPNCRR